MAKQVRPRAEYLAKLPRRPPPAVAELEAVERFLAGEK
jgi:hypothetical protein